MSHSLFTALKPSYFYAPRNLARRVWSKFSPPTASFQQVRLPWGVEIGVDIHDTIGGAIYRQGIFDIGVSECAWRLIKPGDQIVDAGANIGYMTSVFAAKTGGAGKVHSFEPHPVIRKKLESNVARFGKNFAAVTIHGVALGDTNGTADLVEADAFSTNQGTAFLADEKMPGNVKRHQVVVKRLDEMFPEGNFGLIKIDVEGHEAKLIMGAENIFKTRRARNVIYEDHELGQSGLPEMFAWHGYTVFAVGHDFWGLQLTDYRKKIVLDTSWESPSYLATTDPDGVQRSIGRGWSIFKGV
jgi:FkbM family methyltransferase